MKPGYTRWWRDNNGVIERRSTYDGLPEGEGWQPGFPLSKEVTEARRIWLANLRRGSVATAHTRELMRQAKLGTQQSLLHRQHRSEAIKEYNTRVHKFMELHGVSWGEARRQLKVIENNG
jgi:hypothetical protein